MQQMSHVGDDTTFNSTFYKRTDLSFILKFNVNNLHMPS